MKRLIVFTAFSACALMLSACSGSNKTSPTGPSPAPSPDATLRAIVVAGSSNGTNTSSFQMHARADFTDGSSRDITAVARWETSNTALATVSPTGMLTVLGSGQVEVRASYQNMVGAMGLLVSAPAGPPTFTLIGRASESAPAEKALEGVRVEITEGPDAGRAVVSDATGSFRFDGLSKGIIAITAEKSGYQPWRVSNFTVDRSYELEVKLYPTPPKNDNGVSATARCQDGTWSWDSTFTAACAANGGILYTTCPGALCK